MKRSVACILWGVLVFVVVFCVCMAGCAAQSKTTEPSATATRTTEELGPDGKPVKRTTESATARGTGANATGDAVKQTVDSQPANAAIGEHGPVASGGGAITDTVAKSDKSLWIRILCALAGIGCILGGVKLGMTPPPNLRGGLTYGVAGIILLIVAVYPEALIYGACAALAAFIVPYFFAEIGRDKSTEGLRAAMSAVADLPIVQQEEWLTKFRSHASEADRKEYLKWRAKDNLDLPTL